MWESSAKANGDLVATQPTRQPEAMSHFELPPPPPFAPVSDGVSLESMVRQVSSDVKLMSRDLYGQLERQELLMTLLLKESKKYHSTDAVRQTAQSCANGAAPEVAQSYADVEVVVCAVDDGEKVNGVFRSPQPDEIAFLATSPAMDRQSSPTSTASYGSAGSTTPTGSKRKSREPREPRVQKTATVKEKTELEEMQAREMAMSRASEATSCRKTTGLPEDASSWARFQFAVAQLIDRQAFDFAILLAIASNVIVAGVEVDMEARTGLEDVPYAFSVVNNAYAFVFTSEMILKWIGLGIRTYFVGPDRYWNIFDFFIVISALMEVVFSVWMSIEKLSMGHLRIFRVLRVAKIIRGIRVMRILKFVSSLRAILLSIANTLKSLVWTVIFVGLIFYGVGVALTQAVSDHCRDEAVLASGDLNAVPACADDPGLHEFWSSLPTSMFTLFKSIANGLSWHEAVAPLNAVGWPWALVFTVYIGFMFFAVLNVVTGVFCQNAIESASADKEMATMMQLSNQKQYVDAIKGLFKEIDEDDSNVITIDEFEEKLKDENMSAFFASIEIDTADAWTLFSLIDGDKSGCIDLEEFVSGCIQLKGAAKAIHIAKMSYENKITRNLLEGLETLVLEMKKDLDGLQKKMDRRAP